MFIKTNFLSFKTIFLFLKRIFLSLKTIFLSRVGQKNGAGEKGTDRKWANHPSGELKPTPGYLEVERIRKEAQRIGEERGEKNKAIEMARNRKRGQSRMPLPRFLFFSLFFSCVSQFNFFTMFIGFFDGFEFKDAFRP